MATKKRKLPSLSEIDIEKFVFEALDRAYDNGYTLHHEMTYPQIADDLVSYEVTLESVSPELLILPIAKFVEKYEASHEDDE